MKKSIIVFSAILCAAIAQVGVIHMSTAQPAQSSYSQALILSKHDLESRNYEDAEKDARKLLSLANSSEQTSSALTILGETFYRRRMYEEARSQWSKVLSSSTDYGDGFQVVAHLGLARSYTSQGSFDKAIPHYKDVLGRLGQDGNNGQSVIFSLALANAYYKTRQLDLAQQQFQQVIESNQDNPAYLMVALTRSGQINLAKRKFKKSLAGFNQVLAIKEVTPGFKEYAQRQIRGLNNLIPLQLEEGEINSGIGFQVKAERDFDGKIDDFVQILNDTIVDKAVIKALGT